MGVAKPVRDYVDALVHASARCDVLSAARHRAFIATRLFGSFIALALFPLYIALCGVPGAIEVAILSWLVTPMLAAFYLSRTGAYERAQLLSVLSLTGFGATIAAASGGIGSYAAIWLVIVLLDAALSASPRIVAFAATLVFSAAGLLVLLEVQNLLPVSQSPEHALAMIGVASAALYAGALAFGARSLARTGIGLLRAQEDRYKFLATHMADAVTRHDRYGAILFASPAAGPLCGASSPDLLGNGLFDRVHVADRPAYLTTLADAAEFGHERSVEFRVRRQSGRAAQNAQFIWVEMRCRPLENTSDANRREVVAVLRDVTRQREQDAIIETMRADIEQATAASVAFLSVVRRAQGSKVQQPAGNPGDRVKSSA